MKHKKKWAFFIAWTSILSTSLLYSEEELVSDKDLKELQEGEQITILPTKINVKPGTLLKLNLPVFGEVSLESRVTSQGTNEFISLFPRPDKPIDLGVVKVEKGIFRLSEGKITYAAFINFFGKRATVGLKNFSLVKEDADKLGKAFLGIDTTDKANKAEVYSFTLGVKFLEGAATLELIPGQKIALKDIDLTITQRKGVEFRFIGEVLGQRVDFVAQIDEKTKKFSLRGEITPRSLSQVIKELKDSPLDGLSIEGFLEFNFEDGLVLKGELSNAAGSAPEILGIQFKKAKIDVNMRKLRGMVSGETEILGLPLNGFFGIFLGKQKGIRFSAEIPAVVKEWQPFKDVPVEVPALKEIVIRELRGGVEAQYLSAVKGEKEEEKDKDKKKDDNKKPAESSQEKPKEKSDNKKTETKKPEKEEEKDKKEDELTFEEVFEGKETDFVGEKGLKFSVYISGKSRILNTDSGVVVKIDKIKGKGFGATLIADLPDGWKLSQSFPEIFKPKGPLPCTTLPACANICATDAHQCVGIAGSYLMHAFDLLKLDKARFVVSSRKDTIEGDTIEQGFNLMASLSIDDTGGNPFLVLMKDIIVHVTANKEKPSLALSGSFNPASLKTLAFKMQAAAGGVGFKLGPAHLYGGSLNVVLRGEPALGLEGSFKFKPTADAVPIELAVDAAFTPIKFNVAGSMLNTWKDPFGIKGFEFGNLGFRVSQSYEVVAALIAAIFTGGATAIDMFIPSDLGLSGDVRFGAEEGKGRGFEARTRINLGKDISSLAIVADIRDPLSLSLLLEVILKQLGVKVDILKEIDKILPIQLKKAGLKFVPLGTTIGNIKVDQGIGGYGYFDLFGKEAHVDMNLSLSGLTAKGTIPKLEIGPLKITSFDGKGDPIIDIQLNAQEQKFYIDGLFQIGDLLKSKTKWFLTKDEGTGFETETFIGPPEAKLGLKMKATTIPFTDPKQLVELKPEDLKFDIEFNDTLSERIRRNIAEELESSKQQLQNDVNQTIVQLGRATTQQDIDEQQKRVEIARARRFDFFKDPVLSVKREIEFRKEEFKSTLLKEKYKFEQTGFGKFVGQVGQSIGLHKVAQGALEGFREVGVGVIEKGQMVFKDLSKLVIIRRIYWSGSLADLGKGVLPGVQIELCAGCQLIKTTLKEFSVVDPIKSIDGIANQVFTVVRQVLIATFNGDQCEDICAGVTTAQA